MNPVAPRLVRFGVFEFDLTTGDLYNGRRTIRLQEQPRQVLGRLAGRPGELVTREELRALLWPGDTFVDFDTGLNVVVNKIRQALGDSATSPRFIETLPKRGYRFVAPVAPVGTAEGPGVEPSAAAPPQIGPEGAPGDAALPLAARARRIRLGLPAVFVVLLIGVGAGLMRGWREAETPASPATGIRTLAVLPLESLSADVENDYFADGMTDALITDLASIASLHVIARQSTRQFKGSTKSIATIAKELGGVDAVIEGSVLRTGNRVRLIVQLIDARTERHLWARTYEQEITDILQLQREAALTITGEIRATLTPDERSRLKRARRVHPAAYDAYLRGVFWHGKGGTPTNVAQALAEFQRSIDLDASFAPAYVGVAETQLARGSFLIGSAPPLETRPLVYRAARRALDLDPDLGEAYGVMARLQQTELDWAGADRSFARMRALAPGYAYGVSVYAYQLLMQGRADAALEAAQRAVSLDPLNLGTRVTVGFVRALRHENEDAIDIFEQVLALDPGHATARSFLITALVKLDQHDEAVMEAGKLVERFGRVPLTVGRLALARGFAGDRSTAERLIEELRDMASRQYVSPAHFAFAYAALGDRDRTFEWLERAYEERSQLMHLYPLEPIFEWPDDPRYGRLVAKIRQPHTVRDGS